MLGVGGGENRRALEQSSSRTIEVRRGENLNARGWFSRLGVGGGENRRALEQSSSRISKFGDDCLGFLPVSDTVAEAFHCFRKRP